MVEMAGERRSRRRSQGKPFVYTIHHGGCFVEDPFRYHGGTSVSFKGKEYFFDWGSFVEFVRKRCINSISKIYYTSGEKVSCADDVRLVWDEASACDAVISLFESRTVTLFCDHAAGPSIYDNVLVDATIEKGKGLLVYEEKELIEEENLSNLSFFGPDQGLPDDERVVADEFEDDDDYVQRTSENEAVDDDEINIDDELTYVLNEEEYVRSDVEVDPIETDVHTSIGTETEICYRRSLYPRFLKGTSEEFIEGLRFDSKDEIKELAAVYAVNQHRDLRVKRSDSTRVEIVCVNGCPFRVWCSFNKKLLCWQVKTIHSEHNCNNVYNLKLASSKWLAKKFFAELRENPNMRRKELKERAKKGCQIEITKRMAKRVKKVFRSEGTRSSQYEYSLLKGYVSELKRTNVGSTVELNVYQSEDGKTEKFSRLYMCFDACKRGFAAGCRKIVYIDGCFLKTQTKGQMLTAIGRDGNDQMYPIAWC